MAEKIRAVKGMPDLSNPEIQSFQEIEQIARRFFESAGFSEIRTPILEDIALFKRSIGDATDIVEKEMYTLLDRNEKTLAMRPEGTASVVRAYIERYASREPEQRLYYLGPMFRYERPQKGRFRQFHQFGAEIFGVDDPYIDAELLNLATDFLDYLNIGNYRLEINSLGSKASRQEYVKILLKYLSEHQSQLCEKCLDRMFKNTLRVLDCKVSTCQEILKAAPSLLDHIDKESQKDFEQVQNLLNKLQVSFQINPRLVRGLDYYERTAFEFVSDDLGAQSAFAGGGRYNGLIKELGGPDLSAIGFAFGMERLASLYKQSKEKFLKRNLVFIPLGDASSEYCMQLMCSLRKQKLKNQFGEPIQLRAVTEYGDRSLKSKMKRANRFEADFVLILGDDELKSGTILFKEMSSGDQSEVLLSDISALLIDKLQKI